MNIYGQCREIYRQAFDDGDNEFKNDLFDLCYKYCHYNCVDGKAVSMFFSMPCITVIENVKHESFYIFAAATEAANRSKGYMGSLLNDFIKKYDESFIFLKPATDNLFDYYAKFGFNRFSSSADKNCYSYPTGGFKELADKYGGTEKQYDGMYRFNKKIKMMNFPFIME